MTGPKFEVTGQSQMEVSFNLKPKNRRNGVNHSHDKDRGIEPGNVPHISKMMALAIRFDGLVRSGEVRDCASSDHMGQI